MNKLLYTVLIIIVFAASFFAQDFESGAFAAPVFKYTKFIGQSGLVAGVRVGWIINKKIVLGAGYYALSTDIKSSYTDPENNKTVMMNLNYGGLEFEYLLLNDSKFNLTFDMFLGAGGTEFYIKDRSKNYVKSNLLVWEPGLNFEVKLLDWLHADAGISYRMSFDNYEFYNVTRNDLQGINLLMTFKMGKY